MGSVLSWIIFAVGPIAFTELGTMLEDQSERLRQDVYGMNWFEMPAEIRNTFKIFLGKVQKPITLNAPPLMNMNRETLWNMMKGAASFMMYLKNFN